MATQLYDKIFQDFREDVKLDAETFYRIVAELNLAAINTSEECGEIFDKEDTCPGKLAVSLVKTLGYDTIEEFLKVNKDYAI